MITFLMMLLSQLAMYMHYAMYMDVMHAIKMLALQL